MNRDAEDLRDALSLLMPYAVEIRYPDDGFLPTTEDAHEARKMVNQVIEWFKTALPGSLSYRKGVVASPKRATLSYPVKHIER